MDLEKTNEISTLLAEMCNTRPPTFRGKDLLHDYVRSQIYQLNVLLNEDHNCEPYAITLTFSKTGSLQEEWQELTSFVQRLKQDISQDYLIVGGIISVEPHRNTTLTSKKGKNRKSGRPHLHMVLWLTHEYLSGGMQRLGFNLTNRGFNVRLNRLKTHTDVVKASLYALKERKDTRLAQVCQKYMGWPSNTNVWINQPEVENLFQGFAERLNLPYCTKEFLISVPTTRKCRDRDLQLTELFAKLFVQKKFAVREEQIYRRVEGTRHTWERFMPLKQWINEQFQLHMPLDYLIRLKEAATWISKPGGKGKSDVRYDLFPKVSLYMFCVEFNDAIYDFSIGETISFHRIPPNAATVCSVDRLFDDCVPPYRMLGMLYSLIAWGVNSRIEQQEEEEQLIKEKGWMQPQQQDSQQSDRIRHILSSLRHKQRSLERFIDTIVTFGGLYHPRINRKDNPILYLQGASNTFKTFFVELLFRKLVGLEHVDILSRHAGRFNTGKLRKDDGQDYILIMDDLRWDSLGMPVPDLINLIDGIFVKTEQKYLQGQQGRLQGTIAITSNHSIAMRGEDEFLFTPEDRDALKNRIKEVTLYKLRDPQYQQIDEKFWKGLDNEAIGFSILTNACFLAQNKHTRKKVMLPRSFFQTKQTNKASTPEERLENAGRILMDDLLKSCHIEKTI